LAARLKTPGVIFGSGRMTLGNPGPGVVGVVVPVRHGIPAVAYAMNS
jgi:hypothetical protein